MLEWVGIVLLLAWPVLLLFGILMAWAVGMAILDALSEKDEPKEPRLLISYPPEEKDEPKNVLRILRHRLIALRVSPWLAFWLVFIIWVLVEF